MIRQNNGQKAAPGDVSGNSGPASEGDAKPDRQSAPGDQSAGQASGGTGEPQAADLDETAWSAAQFEPDDLNLANLDKVDWGASGDAVEPGPSPEGDVISRDVHLAAVEAETAALRDQLLRAVAETENIRKRAAREVMDARKFAVTAFVKDIVPLTDNFQRVMEAVPADAIASDPALKSLLEGVEMTDRQFLSVLEKHGVKRIVPEGEIFDPHFHQAIAQLPNPELPAGTITDVAQPGFVLGERVLRPAMVVVAQGGPKPLKPADGTKTAAGAVDTSVVDTGAVDPDAVDTGAIDAGDADTVDADPGTVEPDRATQTTADNDGGPEAPARVSGGFGRREAPPGESGSNGDVGRDEN